MFPPVLLRSNHPLRTLVWLSLAAVIGLIGPVGCSKKDIPFTDFLVENLLRNNLESLTRPAIFSVSKLVINSREHSGDSGQASVDITLYFPDSFATVVKQRKLQADNPAYQQFKNSFGEFAAGETQIHHALYYFQRRQGVWGLVGSQPQSAPKVMKPR